MDMSALNIDSAGALDNVQQLFLTWGPRVFAALIILILSHLIAKAVKWGLAAILNRTPLARTANVGAERKETLGARLGEIGYWLVYLIGLIAVLNTLGLTYVVVPLNRLIAGFFAFLPNVVGAGIIFFIGWVVAMVARKIVGSTIAALDVGTFTQKIGFKNLDSLTLAKAVGQLVFVVIIIPVAISGLQALKINAISEPAVAVLRQILDTLPKLLGASIILGVSYFIAKWISGLLEQTLPQFGIDNSARQLGLFSNVPETEFPATKAITWISTFAIMLFAAIEAAKLLNFEAGSLILTQILTLGGRILFGGIIIAAGFALANIIASALARGAGAQASIAASIARFATIGLSVAMGVRFMGIADDIISMAFGLIVGAAAVAAAIAFGWGGREAAAKLLNKWIK